MTTSARFFALSLVAVAFLAGPSAAWGQSDCISPIPGLEPGAKNGETEIKYIIEVDGSPQYVTDWLNAVSFAINQRWNYVCLDGQSAAEYVAGTASDYNVKIIITDQDPHQYPGVGDGSCGVHIENGGGAGKDYIVLFPVALSDCWSGQRARIATHETGHPLGLGDNHPNCTSHIMAPSLTSTSTAIDSSECEKVYDIYTGEQTPLVLDMDRNGIHTSSVFLDPVPFDLDADGVLELSGWLAPDTRDAFLWIDLNGDHVPNDGTELFGGASPLPGGGTASNGMEALAAYDFDGDGKITPADEVWPRLLLWNDRDHSGTLDAGEWISVSDAGILGISLHYNRRNWVDENGNRHTHLSVYWTTGPNGRGLRAGHVEDIWFQVIR